MGWLRSVRRRLRPLSRAVGRRLRPTDRKLLRRVERLERNVAALARLQGAQLATPSDPRADFRSRELGITSQNGEDGLLLHLFSTLGPGGRRLVEFGIGDGRQCNAANLVLNLGWSGLLMDCDADNVAAARHFYYEECGVSPQRLRVERCLVTAENIDEILERYGVRGELDLLSIDVDGNDYWIWKAIQAVRPRVVVIEYNASLGAEEPLVTVYDPGFDRRAKHPSGWYHGAALAALAALGERRGYALVGCDSSGVNAFFVARELQRGRLPARSPVEAYYPDRRRLRRASAAEQRARLRDMPFVRDEPEPTSGSRAAANGMGQAVAGAGGADTDA